LKRLVESSFYILWRMFGVPKLASKKDFRARNTTPPYAVTYFGFIAVDGSAINVAVACFERRLDSAFDFSWLRLPCAEAYSRYLRACVEGEMCRDRHDAGRGVMRRDER
jgi:hypothetical protein